MCQSNFDDLRADNFLGTLCDFWCLPKGGPNPKFGINDLDNQAQSVRELNQVCLILQPHLCHSAHLPHRNRKKAGTTTGTATRVGGVVTVDIGCLFVSQLAAG